MAHTSMVAAARRPPSSCCPSTGCSPASVPQVLSRQRATVPPSPQLWQRRHFATPSTDQPPASRVAQSDRGRLDGELGDALDQPARNNVIALPSPSDPAAAPPVTAAASTSYPASSPLSGLPEAHRPRPEPHDASPSSDMHRPPPLAASQDSVVDPPSKQPHSSSSAPSSTPATPPTHPSSWRPPFPLPTDLSTLLFRLRSLQTSTAHLVRGRLADYLSRASAAIRQARATAEEERVRLLTAGKLVFGQVGGRVNSVTGYDGIERLKEGVRVKELALTELRVALTEAKTTYHQTLSSSSASQRELNDLLQRKHSWSTADVERFTLLVREDHESSAAAAHAKDTVERLEGEADRAFDGLMRAILQRYHEEQTWSDKLRSLSSYTQLLVLGVNALLFLGAVVVVEPWKRRRMVDGFEGRVREMSAEMGATVRDEVEGLRRELVALRSPTPGTTPAAASSAATMPTLAEDPSVLPPPSVAHLVETAPAVAQSPQPLPRPPWLLPTPTFPYHYPSPALLALPSRAVETAQAGCVKAWLDAGSAERGLAIATGVGVGVVALIVALFKR